jgi:hypothetical protein
MNRVVPSGRSTDSAALSWRGFAGIHRLQGEKVFAAVTQGAPEERSQRRVPPLRRGQPPSGGQPLTAPHAAVSVPMRSR